MGLFIVRLSDIGEGVAEAELIEWHVATGDTVAEDQLLGVVMTDKAAVDVPSSVLGKVVKLCAEVGDVVAVGAELIHLDVDGAGNADAGKNAQQQSKAVVRDENNADKVEDKAADRTEDSDSGGLKDTGLSSDRTASTADENTSQNTSQNISEPRNTNNKKVLAAPSVRQKARDLGVELSTVTGSGPAGRIVHNDLERFTERRAVSVTSAKQPDNSVDIVKVVGLRRKIAEKMALSHAKIPHITIVEEINVHYLEELRAELNEKHREVRGKLTLLPFVMKSIVEAVREQPELNAHYDDEAETITRYKGVHIGVATQTSSGLVVPVMRHCETNSLWESASEVERLADETRQGRANRDDLSGSTITITSLGPLGAVATTPIINHPEVAIVGINKIMVRPFWDGQQFVPRNMMNLSCSFDHRVIDGWDAAVFVNRLKALLEKPAMLFMSE